MAQVLLAIVVINASRALAYDVSDFYERNVKKYECKKQRDTKHIATSALSNHLNDDKDITLGLIKRIGTIPNLTGLDCGCGPYATDMKIFASFGYEMFGFDASNAGVTRNIELHPDLFNTENMRHLILPTTFPYDKDQFDFVQMRAVIQHLSIWTDVIAVFDEIHRVLRPGGIFSLIFKHGAHETSLTIFDRNYDEYRTFTLYDVNITLSYLVDELQYELIQKSGADGLGGVMYYTNHQPISHCIMWFRKKMLNILQMYNVALDTQIELNKDGFNPSLEYQVGGGLYGSCMTSMLGSNMHLVSKHSKEHHSLALDVVQNPDSIHQIESANSTFCHHMFIRNKRFTYIPKVAPAFHLDEIENHIINRFNTNDISMIVFGGLHSFEFPWQYYPLVTQKYDKSIVIIDAQALFRKIHDDGSTSTDLKTFDEFLDSNNVFLDYVHLLKIGMPELNALHNMSKHVNVEGPFFRQWIVDGVNILFDKYQIIQSVLITTSKYLIYCSFDVDASCHYQEYVNGISVKQTGRGDTALLAFSINFYLYHKDIEKSLLLTKHYIEYGMQQSDPICNRLYN
eukprot:232248_1